MEKSLILWNLSKKHVLNSNLGFTPPRYLNLCNITIKLVLICLISLLMLACGGGGGGGGFVAFQDKPDVHNGGDAGGFGTGNQTGGGFDGGSDITSSELLISKMAALNDISKVEIHLTINGAEQEVILADATTTTDVLPKTKVGDIVYGYAVIFLPDNETRRADLDETEIALHNVLEFKVPYYYKAYDLSGTLVKDGIYFARDGIPLEAETVDPIAGWKCREDGSMHYGGNVFGVRGDILLDAVLQAGSGTYSITYVSAAQPVAGETYSVTAAKTLPTPTKAGLTFAGWFEDAAFSSSVVTEIPVNSTGNKTFYAKWTAIVSFNSNGGSGTIANQTVTYGGTASEPGAASNPTRAGCNFLDWRTSSNGGTTLNATAYSFSTPVTGNLTLYANWDVEEYSVTYISAAQPVAAGTYTAITGLTLPTPTKTGLTFAGWYENSSFTGSRITSISAGTTGDKTYYAKWTATVTFNTNGGSAVSNQTVTYNGTATQPATNPTRANYSFGGWYTSSDGGTTLNTTAYSFGTAVTQNITLYAKWNAIAHNLSFVWNNVSGATGGPSNTTFNQHAGYSLASVSAPTCTGLIFAGWYDNAAFTGTAVTSIPAGTNSNVTLYAKWTATVTFDKKGGSGTIANQTITYNGTATQPAVNPTKSGYEFKGWYTSSDGGTTLSATAYSFSTAVTQNITLYAKWDEYTNFVGTAAEFAAALFKTGSSLGSPYNVKITDASNSNLNSIAAAVASKGVYVNLTLQSSGNNLTSINYFGYRNPGAVTYLISLVIPEGVTEIAYQAFQDSSSTHNFKSVTIPASLTKIEGQAFTSCVSLTNVIVHGTNNWKKRETNSSGVLQETIIGPLTVTNITDTHGSESKLRVTD